MLKLVLLKVYKIQFTKILIWQAVKQAINLKNKIFQALYNLISQLKWKAYKKKTLLIAVLKIFRMKIHLFLQIHHIINKIIFNLFLLKINKIKVPNKMKTIR